VTGDNTLLLLFETATHVMWAEEVAAEAAIPVEVVPAPDGAADSCGIALKTARSHEGALRNLLTEEGIPFGLHV
jgi:hypothetical protein